VNIQLQEEIMESFVRKHAKQIIGLITGFDRLVFRGVLRTLSYVGGMMMYLGMAGVLLKDFAEHALSMTSKIKEASLEVARIANRPIIYLPSSQTSKEDAARGIAAKDGISTGLVCVLTSVEPCLSYEIFRNRETKHLELQPRWRKCLHLYHYQIHPQLGFMHARIQTWFPFNIQICINGREWLSRQMNAAGLAYRRRDNCFPWIEDPIRAQFLMESQLKANWPELLNPIVRQINPIHNTLFKAFPIDYYWTVHQSEWATDIMFRDSAALADLYPSLVHHGITTFGSPDVMRFLGRKPVLHPAFNGQVISDYKDRAEGVRIKHRLNHNSIKVYDKEGSILRVETTINDPQDFKVFRPKEGEPEGEKDWRPMRKGVADLHRRAEVSEAANERYVQALASVEETTPLSKLAEPLCQPVQWKGKRVRALNLHCPEDASLLQAISRGEFAINGFRNRDLQVILFPNQNADQKQRRRVSAIVTRKLRILRAHGLVKKVAHTHRYLLTDKGRTAITTILAARNADANSLTKLAA
jgi:hypothetical protein